MGVELADEGTVGGGGTWGEVVGLGGKFFLNDFGDGLVWGGREPFAGRLR